MLTVLIFGVLLYVTVSTGADVVVLTTENRQQEVTEFDLANPSHKNRVHQHRKNPSGISYDPVEEKMYWAEPGAKAIYSSKVDESQHQTVHSNVNVYDVTVNIEGREVIYTDSRSISRISIKDHHVSTVVSHATGAIDIEYDPIDKHIYWSNFIGNVIEKCTYPAGQCSTLVKTPFPLNMAIDPKGKRLYWVSGSHEQVESIGLDGHNQRTEMSSNDDMYTALDFYDGNLYVGVHNSKQAKIEKYDVNSRHTTTITTEDYRSYYDIAVSPKQGSGHIIG
ncbi:hypothetical protein SNE40_012761 [Patella caerulea]|uniref:Uncharacterized protein n=1 Tax=Patella caerulea TaxID=87958 RepID=A0AAN8JGM9_PATCE